MRVGWVFLCFLAAASLPLPNALACTGQDRCYDSNQTLQGSVTVANGNVTIESGVRLVLRDSDLVLRGPGLRTLAIEPGAVLALEGGRVLADGATLDIRVQGLLEAAGGDLVGARSLRVLAGGRVDWERGTLTLGDGLSSVPGTLVEIGQAGIVTGDSDASEVLAGTTRLAGVRWNGTGAVRWTGELDGAGVVARGPTFLCEGGSVALRDADLHVAGGTALTVQACPVSLERSTLTGPDALAASQGSTGLVAGGLLNATDGRALRAIDGADLTLRGTRLRATAQAVDVEGATAALEDADAASATGAAVRCASGHVVATRGTWRAQALAPGPAPAAMLTHCTGSLAGLALHGRGAAVRWDNAAAGQAVTTQQVRLADLHFTNGTGGGDGIAFAYDVRADGAADRLQSAATLGLVRWRQAGAAVPVLANLTATSASCAIAVGGSEIHLRGLEAAAGATAVCSTAGVLRVAASDLSVAQSPLVLHGSAARLADVRLDPTRNVLDATSSVESERAFAPRAVYKNGEPAEGATIAIRTLDNATLAEGTADATGRSAPLPRLVFRQTSTHLERGSDVMVHASLGSLATGARLALDADPLQVELVDDKAPGALGNLTRRSTIVSKVGADWDVASDDHLPPRYEVRLRTPPGAKALLANGTQAAIDQVTMVATTGATLDLPGQGWFWLNVTPVDRSGNRGAGRGLEAVWDTGKPTVQVRLGTNASASGWHTSPVPIQAVGVDRESGIATTLVHADGAQLPGARLESSGIHQVEVVVRDRALNEARANLTVRVDLDAPQAMGVRALHGRTGGLLRVEVIQPPHDATSGVAQVRAWFEVAGVRHPAQTLQPPFPPALAVALPAPDAGTLVLETIDVAGNSALAPGVAVAADEAALRPALEHRSESEEAAGGGLVAALAALLGAFLVCRTCFKR